jgi:Pentapeptide repeats (8 copies)
MAKEPGQEEKGAGQDDPLYKEWLSSGQEHLSRVFGRRLAGVLIAFAITLLVFLAVSFVSGLIWYLNPIFSANDKLSTTDRKDLVQGFASVAQAAAVGLAGAVGLVGLFFTWRSLRQAREGQAQTQENTQRTLELTEQGQITERFTRAIDQLGATDATTGKQKLEIRLGGIYALDRIARDSPKRDYSTVMEVLTAYVRENTPQALGSSQGSSEAASTSTDSTAAADEGAKQAAPPEPSRPTADIQAILDVLRRTQDRVPEEYRTWLDLHEANLRGANLSGANLSGANLRDADLQAANLQRANLQDANLQDADLQDAILGVASLVGANLLGANLYGVYLEGAIVTDEQLADTLSLREAIMPDGQKYEDWLKDRKPPEG